ncbi:MAG: hypothetical protein CMI32_07745 [Opitutales bacterium]|nr:hypothetical protein [Opitutales bacterium]
MKNHRPSLLLLCGLFATTCFASAKPLLLHLAFEEIEITSGELPKKAVDLPHSWEQGRWIPEITPYAASPDADEIYLTLEQSENNNRRRRNQFRASEARISIKAKKLPLEGILFLPTAEGEGLKPIGFRVKKGVEPKKQAFHKARKAHYEQLLARDIPGAAWFRHQADAKTPDGPQRPNRPNRGDLEDTLDLFSGGRALSENLQFDRELRLPEKGDATVKVDSIKGITIDEFDWDQLLEDRKTVLDPLASSVPADQHALFFPTFADMMTVFDEATLRATPLLRMFEARAESAKSKEKYELQLCLPATELSRLLGPQLIDSVAFTSSDPFLRTGTDLAILYKAKNRTGLVTALALRRAQTAVSHPDAKSVQGKIAGISYAGLVSKDRSVCSYVATLGEDVVVVANSLAQLKKLADANSGQTASLAQLDEFRFFRQRYLHGSHEETAFLMVSDATLRRWCGPRWRIAASRRTRAAAALSELQARHLAGEEQTANDFPELGEISVVGGQVQSTVYGNLRFLTPISELDVYLVSKREQMAYDVFRDRYQSNWSAFFDPIAARLFVDEDKLTADVTILPLIEESDYNELIAVTGKSRLEAGDGDPHQESLFHWILALDMKSPTMQQASGFASLLAPSLGVNAFSWAGDWASVYADDSPFWKDLGEAAEKGEDAVEEFIEDNVARAPLAVNVDVTNPFKLTAFLSALRAWIEQTSPGMTEWTNHEHNGQGYVKIAPSGEVREDLAEEGAGDLALYYAPTSKLLTLSLDEAVLKRSLDRRVAERKRRQDKEPVTNLTDWPGKSISFVADKQIIAFVDAVSRDHVTREFRTRSFANLPILNEWRKLGHEDALAFHEKTWQVELMCPGGGEYRWNEKFQTYESSVFGHPGEPQSPKISAFLLKEFQQAAFGLTFENDGLRAKGELLKRLPGTGD